MTVQAVQAVFNEVQRLNGLNVFNFILKAAKLVGVSFCLSGE
jgi:hypothetical protein